MKKMLMFEKEEKEVIKKASALIRDYCEEMGDCEDDCPFYKLCTKLQECDVNLNLPEVFAQTRYVI